MKKFFTFMSSLDEATSNSDGVLSKIPYISHVVLILLTCCLPFLFLDFSSVSTILFSLISVGTFYYGVSLGKRHNGNQ